MAKVIEKLFSAIAIAGICAASSASATTIAQCGASFGQAYFDGINKWESDQISQGSWQFVVDDKGNPNVYFRDATGRVTDSAADGAQISISFIHPEKGEMGLVAVYADAGVVETYQIFLDSSERKRLFWTSTKSRSAAITKVAAYVADCN